jgi:hypothetical protein
MKLYKMRSYYSNQPWYEKDSIFELIHKTERWISYFGIDCEWRNIHTGELINNWDRIMEEISIEETKQILRNINLHKLGIL